VIFKSLAEKTDLLDMRKSNDKKNILSINSCNGRGMTPPSTGVGDSKGTVDGRGAKERHG